jgi:hypothetical protein
MMGKPFRGLSLLGYDNFKQTFNSVWLSDMQTSMFTTEGKGENGFKTITLKGVSSCPATGRKDIPMKVVLRILSPDKHTFEMFDGSTGAGSFDVLFQDGPAVSTVTFELPDSPAIGEVVPGYVATNWYALFGPRGLPDTIVARLQAELLKARDDPSLKERAAAVGMTLMLLPADTLRARIETEKGAVAVGGAAELMVPKWFDKSPTLTNDENFDQLRRSLDIARSYFLDAGTDTPFGLSAAVDAAHHAACERAGLNGLVASFGLAVIERAIIDALGRLEGASVFELVRSNRIALTAATAPDLAGFDFDAFLADLRPAPSIFARHTVGLVDALTQADTAGKRLDDGLPESLEEVIASYGQRYFKLKVAGSLDADIDRLARVAAVLDRIPEPYFTTLDGNEQFEHVDAVIALWHRINAEERLARLKASILFIEQPIARAKALAEPIHKLTREIAVEIDESDADIGVFPEARALGYRGISAKSCKGFYRALLNRARIAHWNTQGGSPSYFMSCEDLTTQGGIAVQQDLALATLVGATHVERNGHHYVDGMAGASEREQLQFLTAHPELYQRTDGRVRLAIRSGVLALGSLAHTAGLAVGVMPEWDAMQPMRLSDRAGAETAIR